MNLIELGEMIEQIKEDIKGLKPGSEEREREIRNLEKLQKLYDEEAEKLDNGAKNDKESLFKRVMQILDVGGRLGLGLLGIAVSAGISVWFAKVGFKFEETGTFTSKIFGNGIRNFFKWNN